MRKETLNKLKGDRGTGGGEAEKEEEEWEGVEEKRDIG